MIGRKKLVRESERDQKCEEKLCAFSDRNKRLRNGTGCNQRWRNEAQRGSHKANE